MHVLKERTSALLANSAVVYANSCTVRIWPAATHRCKMTAKRCDGTGKPCTVPSVPSRRRTNLQEQAVRVWLGDKSRKCISRRSIFVPRSA